MAVAMESGCWSSPKFGIGKKRGWGEDSNKLLQFMMGQAVREDHEESISNQTATLDLLGGSSSSCTSSSQVEQLELDLEVSPPSGWEKRLDLKLGRFYFVNLSTGRTTYENPSTSWSLQSEIDKIDTDSSPETVDLKLELGTTISKSRNISTIEAVKEALKLSQYTGKKVLKSPTTSSTSSSSSSDRAVQCRKDSKVFLTGCKMCLMYVMITSSDPRCPKCGSSVAADIPLQSQSKKPKLELDL